MIYHDRVFVGGYGTHLGVALRCRESSPAEWILITRENDQHPLKSVPIRQSGQSKWQMLPWKSTHGLNDLQI